MVFVLAAMSALSAVFWELVRDIYLFFMQVGLDNTTDQNPGG